jgi:DNA ligase-1
VPLDGELWLGRKLFQRAVSIVRRQDQSDLWRDIKFLVFDAPAVDSEFEARLRFVRECVTKNRPPYAQAHEHVRCQDVDHLRRELARIEALGGEGLMLRRPGSKYEVGRSTSLLKVKSFHDSEARVVGHEPGAGRHKGRLGALLVELTNGTRFAVGTGFSDAEREHPPAIGSVITFRYQELSDGGVPRFPSFIGVRADAALSPGPAQKTPVAPPVKAARRRFEYVGGGSDKFWEVAVEGAAVSLRFGHNGTQGQVNTKTFKDEAAARAYADKQVQEKTAKGYVEVG